LNDVTGRGPSGMVKVIDGRNGRKSQFSRSFGDSKLCAGSSGGLHCKEWMVFGLDLA
jgi:hypothetical protein